MRNSENKLSKMAMSTFLSPILFQELGVNTDFTEPVSLAGAAPGGAYLTLSRSLVLPLQSNLN